MRGLAGPDPDLVDTAAPHIYSVEENRFAGLLVRSTLDHRSHTLSDQTLLVPDKQNHSFFSGVAAGMSMTDFAML